MLVRVVADQPLLIRCRDGLSNHPFFVHKSWRWRFGITSRIGVKHIPKLAQVHSDGMIGQIDYSDGNKAILALSALVERPVDLYLRQSSLKNLMPSILSAGPETRWTRCRQEAKLGAGIALQL